MLSSLYPVLTAGIEGVKNDNFTCRMFGESGRVHLIKFYISLADNDARERERWKRRNPFSLSGPRRRR